MAALMHIAAEPHIDGKRYGRLLARHTPKIIETEEENDSALAVIEGLMKKGEDNPTPEENILLALPASLVKNFEETAYPIADAAPREVLRDFMEHNGLKAIDLAGKSYPANGRSA
jgi:HTH-type transcriptional regulator / antitoxin HigA